MLEFTHRSQTGEKLEIGFMRISGQLLTFSFYSPLFSEEYLFLTGKRENPEGATKTSGSPRLDWFNTYDKVPESIRGGLRLNYFNCGLGRCCNSFTKQRGYNQAKVSTRSCKKNP